MPIDDRNINAGATQNQPLNIAFDAGFLALPPAGIGAYVEGVLGAHARRSEVVVQRLSPPPVLRRLGERAMRISWDAAGVELARIATARTADLLHVPAFSAPLWTGGPLVVTVHDMIPFLLPEYRASRARAAYLGIMRRTVQRASIVLTPSESAASDIVGVLGIPRDRIHVTPLAADSSLVPAEDRDAARDQVAEWFDIRGRYFLHIAGFDRRKNVPLLVRAFARALPRLPHDVMLVLAGAPHTANLTVFPPVEPVVRAEGIADRVAMTGRVTNEQRRVLYQGALGYVTPSTHEGFGLTPLEAMACGVPVIAANRTSLPEVVGDAGILVEPDVDDLAEALVRLVEDASLHESLSRLGLQRASTFTWDRTSALTTDAYRDAVAGTGETMDNL